MHSGPLEVLVLLVLSLAQAQIVLLGGTYQGLLQSRLLLSTTNSSRPDANVCLTTPVEVPVQMYVDPTGMNFYYYNGRREFSIAGEVLVVEEVKTGGKLVSHDGTNLLLSPFQAQEAATQACIRMKLSTTAGNSNRSVSYAFTNGISSRYSGCDNTATSRVARCQTADPDEFTSVGTLQLLDEATAASVRTIRGWAPSTKDETYCSENTGPFHMFKPVDCNLETPEEPFPLWIIICAAICAVVLVCGIIFAILRCCVKKYGQSRSFWCILCICAYRCFMKPGQTEDDIEDGKALVPMAVSAARGEVVKVKPNHYKPGWANRYGEEAQAWAKYSA